MSKINGGYPPLVKCVKFDEPIDKDTGKKLKKRFFSPKQDINIRTIFINDHDNSRINQT